MIIVTLDVWMQKVENRSIFVFCIKLNYQCIKGLNIKLDTPNLIDEKVGNNLETIAQETTC